MAQAVAKFYPLHKTEEVESEEQQKLEAVAASIQMVTGPSSFLAEQIRQGYKRDPFYQKKKLPGWLVLLPSGLYCPLAPGLQSQLTLL